MEYSIGDFSKLTGLGIHTLRYYEHEGLIAPERNSGNRRCYSDKDLAWTYFIKRLKDTGMPIKEIKHYAKLNYYFTTLVVHVTVLPSIVSVSVSTVSTSASLSSADSVTFREVSVMNPKNI